MLLTWTDEIEQAHKTLRDWVQGRSEGEWVKEITPAVMERTPERGQVVSFGGYSDADSSLIIALAGNSDFLDHLEVLLEAGIEGFEDKNATFFTLWIARAINESAEKMRR